MDEQHNKTIVYLPVEQQLYEEWEYDGIVVQLDPRELDGSQFIVKL
jgi:hypothetical protein